MSPPGAEKPEQYVWKLGNDPVTVTDNCTHLGVDRYSDSHTSNEFIDDRVKLARRTSYALMGAGLHGTNGINVPTCRKMITTYVIPRLAFGLEAMILSKKHREMMEVYYRSVLKHVQTLPDRVANEAPYLMMGLPPIEATLDIKTITFFGTIARTDRRLHSLSNRSAPTGNKNIEVKVLVYVHSKADVQVWSPISTPHPSTQAIQG
jgi:hypothetical protein